MPHEWKLVEESLRIPAIHEQCTRCRWERWTIGELANPVSVFHQWRTVIVAVYAPETVQTSGTSSEMGAYLPTVTR